MRNKVLLAASVGAAMVIMHGGGKNEALASSIPTPAASALPSGNDLATRCFALNSRQIGGGTVVAAEFVPSGSALPPIPAKNSPEFCRVSLHISPVQGSLIKIQLWLPSKWNGKFTGFGGGGFEGSYSIANIVLRRAASEGYAAVVTDAGHDVGTEPKWALGQPQKIADFGHRANHLGAVVGKAVIADFYGTPAKRAFFQGCSNGGRDALMLAQRYPADYDAIAAGAPANNFTARMASFVTKGEVLRKAGGASLTAKLKLVNDAVLAKCDTLDGVKDGLIERPNLCRFDPAVLQCKAGTSEACLSKPEVEVIKATYRGTMARNGKLIMSGYPVGSEHEWANWLIGANAGPNMGANFYRYMIYDSPAWSPESFNLDRDYSVARSKYGVQIDATEPDISSFLRRGGKLLMYHGWDDAAIPAGNTLRYHDALLRTVSKQQARSVRLFMLPGVGHCGDGRGPDQVDFLSELDRWSESNVAPERMIATKHDNRIAFFSQLPTKTLRTRPICAWPKAARYKGTGSTDNASNFECR